MELFFYHRYVRMNNGSWINLWLKNSQRAEAPGVRTDGEVERALVPGGGRPGIVDSHDREAGAGFRKYSSRK